MMLFRKTTIFALLLWAGFMLLLGGCVLKKDTVKADGSEESSALASASPESPAPELEIQGLEEKEELLSNVRAHLSLGQEGCDAPPWRVRQRYDQSEADVGRALRALGYYSPKVTKDLFLSCPTLRAFGEAEARDGVSASSARSEAGSGEAPTSGISREAAPETCKEDCWSARFVIDPGQPTRVSKILVTIRGDAKDDPAFREILDALPIKEGDVLNHAHYDKIKDDIAGLAASLGYFNGRFVTHELRVDADALQADIHLVYDSGPRYRFGELDIHHEGLDEGFVERFIDWDEGAPFDTQRLSSIHRTLVDSGYFSSVEVTPRLNEEDGQQIPVAVDLDPRKRYRFSFGLGATTDGGPSGSFGVLNRRFNRRGHQWSSDTALSLVESGINTEYRIPLADPRTDWLRLQAGYRVEDTDTAESRGLRLGIRHTRRYDNDWLGTVSLDALRENFTTGDTDNAATMVVAGMGFSHGRYDDRIRPRHGHRLDVEFNMSHSLLLSDSSFIQGHASGKWVRGLDWGGRVILRGELGTSWVDEFNELPTSYRFFAGGDKSIRGYGFHELGPVDENGDVIGGPHIMVGSLEYEHPILDHWALTAFVDHGNAMDDNIFSAAMKTGVGFGVRWFSPFGPAGVDFAFPLDEDASTVRLHLSVGVDL
uniref:Translocation and assembly module subunit TamA n=1 Tax=Candidatus Kentrum sp. DK TaxID=2126562 RepID=A0A450RYG5_9GAMM|nr:MAG: autotransporter secretion outer membrane protein TamA [Candidatus Kentron sp. DK]